MLRIRVVVAAFALALGATQLNAQIVNGGFETGSLSPWYQGLVFCTFGPSCVSWSVTDAEAHTGTWSAVDQGNIELRQDFTTPILGSEITSFKYWMMQDVPSISFFQFYYTDATTGGNTFSGSSEWAQLDALPFLDPTKTVSGFSIFGVSGPTVNFTYLDDFTMTTGVVGTVTPEPASIALLATGLVGMVGTGLRRRRTA